MNLLALLVVLSPVLLGLTLSLACAVTLIEPARWVNPMRFQRNKRRP